MTAEPLTGASLTPGATTAGAVTPDAVTPGATTAGSLAVHEHGAPLAGPGTGRATVDARPVAVESFDPADFADVTGREEQWRFTPVRRIAALLDGGEGSGDGADVSWTTPDHVAARRVPREDPLVGVAGLPADRAAAVALRRSTGALVLHVPAGAVLEEPLTVSAHGTGGTGYGHLVVEVGAGARATVVVEHTGPGTHSAGLELVTGEGAQVTLVSLQQWAADAVHLGQHSVLVGRDASVKVAHVTLGGSLVRLSTRVRYAGPGGDAELLGLYVAGPDQHLEHRTLVDHQVPRCRSRVSYKGALHGRSARTVWVGDVVIGADAVGTDTYELNRNLLLTEGARADSVPNLEILTGEVVGAGHASTTGRFDDEQLFYLQSRGIPEDEARRLVVRAFFAELVQSIGVPALEERLMSAVDAELATAAREVAA